MKREKERYAEQLEESKVVIYNMAERESINEWKGEVSFTISQAFICTYSCYYSNVPAIYYLLESNLQNISVFFGT